MEREAIKKLLPHREPMLLLDTVEEQDGEAVGCYTVRGDEFFRMAVHGDYLEELKNVENMILNG